jgi:general secretion pathway protein G
VARQIAAVGFSLLELVIVIVIISVLAVFALQRLIAIQVDAERVAMETVVGALRSALGIKVAEIYVRQDFPGLAALAAGNPMERLAQVPANYLGALDRPEPTRLPDGRWYYDRGRGELVYLVRHSSFFEGGQPNPARARFTVRVVYSDRNGNGRYDPGVDAFEGINLVALEPYRWTP